MGLVPCRRSAGGGRADRRRAVMRTTLPALLTQAVALRIASMLQDYAEQTYNVILTITSMTACSSLPASPAAAPAPAPARRLLAH